MAKKKVQNPRPILDVRAPATPSSGKNFGDVFKKFRPRTSRWAVAIIVLLVLLSAVFVRKYIQTRNEMILNDPAKLATHIGKFLELPSNETPTLATVKDADKVRSQAFFRNAQDDDKVLIYSKSGKAVLYRPSSEKVIEFATVSLGGTTNDAKP